MNLRQIETFLCVAREGSFSKAAAKEYLSSSALLQQIQTLEKELDFSLFSRSSAGVKLTAGGRRLYDCLSKAIPEMKTLLEQCRQLEHEGGLQLSIGICENAQPCFAPLVAQQVQKRCPDMKIRFVTMAISQMLDAIKGGALDVCEYAYSPEIAQKNLRFCQYYTAPRWALVSPEDPLARKEAICREDLAGRMAAVHNFEWCPDLVSWCAQQPPIPLQCVAATNELIYGVCMESGVYFLPQDSALRFSALKALPVSPTFYTTYGFAYRDTGKRSVDLFIRAAAGCVGAQAPRL